jgi:hypothetical protein
MDPLTLFGQFLVGSFVFLLGYPQLHQSVKEKVYMHKTGDSRYSRLFKIQDNFNEVLDVNMLVINKTTYKEILERFKDYIFLHRTHKIVRRNTYKREHFYFSKELEVQYEKINFFENDYFKGFARTRYFIVYFFFKDEVLSNYLILDCKYNAYGNNENCVQSFQHYENYSSFAKLSDCNYSYYKIFSLGKNDGNFTTSCDFGKDEYWDDPEIEWEKLYEKQPKPSKYPYMDYICGTAFYKSCDAFKDRKTRKQILRESLEKPTPIESAIDGNGLEYEKIKTEKKQVPEIKMDQ